MLASAMSNTVADYAVTEAQSQGRRYAEDPPAYRSQFQRDRDRIVHCSAFRRLEYKTQVFVNHEGDMFRTRLTHSLEVAQIARTIARALALNEDLTETIALAHDLGHTPFGHAGQTALNACLKGHGGFEHNHQSLRVVDHLEERYPQFPGLNLLYESREGILKHCSVARARELGPLGRRFIEKTYPSMEAQIANLADEIAYNHHDIDDGLRADLLSEEQLMELELFRDFHAAATRRWPAADAKVILHSVIRAMVNYFVTDLIDATTSQIDHIQPRSVEAVRECGVGIVKFSPAAERNHHALKRLLRTALYHHPRVLRSAENARTVISRLFDAYMDDPQSIPGVAASADAALVGATAQLVADYIAGMTDRFAIGEHQRLFGHPQFNAP